MTALADAAERHSDALAAWLAASGAEANRLRQELDAARTAHRALDQQACEDSVPPCWLFKFVRS